MKVVCDIEANSLHNPTKVWCIVCKDIDTGEVHKFRRVTDDQEALERFRAFSGLVHLWVGHNFLEYDWPVLVRLCGVTSPNISDHCLDTLILSRLVHYSREGGHSIERYGQEFGIEKGKFNDWTKWSQEMEDYCERDVEICFRIYRSLLHIITDPQWHSAIQMEHRFQLVVNDLHDFGFAFNSDAGTKLLDSVTLDLRKLDAEIEAAFPPREVLIREFTPKATKFGTISKTSVPRTLWPHIHLYEVDKTYRHTRMEAFNASSHKQLIQVLTEAGWRPEDKTQTHIETERELNRLKYTRKDLRPLDLKKLSDKLEILQRTGWKINEHNLGTLPETAPPPARLLAKRIMLEARRRTLTEWLGLVQDDGRIHGKFLGIGAWTGRMAHQLPNTANIPREFKEDGSPKLLGKEMRSLWIAPKRRLLVGVDAEGIQLRIFAHYINDPEFTDALVKGSKADKSDPHSLNQRILGSACKSRQAAKRFIYALLLGAGPAKLAAILDASASDTKKALDRLLERYTGWTFLRKEVFPKDANRGWFVGLDGRKVPIPGDTQRDREHLCMSGYLQNGEKIIMARAAISIDDQLLTAKRLRHWFFCNLVHDELQSETKNSLDFALKVAKIKADAIRQAGEELGLRCPMAGSYYNDDIKDYTIGTNWYRTH